MFSSTRALACGVVGLLCAPAAVADVGVRVGSAVAQGWRVSLLASPWPLRAGPAEFGVLLQDVGTREPLLDAELQLELHRIDSPAPRIWAPTVRGAGGNPLLYSARLELSAPGRWQVRVREADASLPPLAVIDVDVAPAASLFARHAGALSFPLFAVALFGLHQYLSRGRTG